MYQLGGFHDRIGLLRAAFIAGTDLMGSPGKTAKAAQQAEIPNSKGNDPGSKTHEPGSGSAENHGIHANGRKKKVKYVPHDTLKVKVFAYQNPEILNRVDMAAPWYKESKVVESGGYWVIVLTNGYRVKYSVQVYTFHGVKNDERKLQQLFNYLKRNPKRDYSGWLHHANIYYQVTRSFSKQVPLNYFL